MYPTMDLLDPVLEDGTLRARLVVPDKAIDMYGHANNIAYVRWLQDVAVLHSEQVGLGWEVYVKLGAAFVIRRQTIDYLRPLRKGDAVSVATWVVSQSRSSSLRRTEMRNAAGEIVFKAETTWIFVSLETGRPLEMPDDIRARFATKASVPAGA